MSLFTIGHSNRTLDQFVDLLVEFEIAALADIRSFPKSRAFPHFDREMLQPELARHGIGYAWLHGLGGHRSTRRFDHTLNTGIKSVPLRAYADYMLTDEFTAAVGELLLMARLDRTAVMCAEKLYTKCHRRLLCDYLVAHDVEIVHIIAPATTEVHVLSDDAIVREDGTVIYPPVQAELL